MPKVVTEVYSLGHSSKHACYLATSLTVKLAELGLNFSSLPVPVLVVVNEAENSSSILNFLYEPIMTCQFFQIQCFKPCTRVIEIVVSLHKYCLAWEESRQAF